MNAQTLLFSNGIRLLHDAASQSTEKFAKDICTGKLVIEGMTAQFTNPYITIRGLSKKPASTLKILKGT